MSGAAGPDRAVGFGDDDLGRALSSGLGRAVGGDVDGDALVRGAFVGARRIRRRRTAVRTAAVLVCAAAVLPVASTMLPFGGASGGATSTAGGAYDANAAPEAAAASSAAGDSGSGSGQSRQVAGGSDAPAAAQETGPPGPATPQPLETGVQVSKATGALPRDGAELVVPDAALLTADDLGVGPVALDSDTASAQDTVTTVQPLCTGVLPGSDRAAGGRTLRWTADDGWQVATSVRVFAGDGAADQLAFLRRRAGVCPTPRLVSRETVTGLPAEATVLASLAPDASGAVTVVGAVRRGRTTAGVEVVVPATVGADAEARRALGLERARSLLVRAHGRLADLSAQAAKDPSLAG